MATAIICDYCEKVIVADEGRYIVAIGHYEPVDIELPPAPAPLVGNLPIGGEETGNLNPTDGRRNAYHEACWTEIALHLTP